MNEKNKLLKELFNTKEKTGFDYTVESVLNQNKVNERFKENHEDALMDVLLKAFEEGEEIDKNQLRNRTRYRAQRKMYKDEGLSAKGGKFIFKENVLIDYVDDIEKYGYDDDGKIIKEFDGDI